MFESINFGGANETRRILLITYRISGSDDFTDVKSVKACLNYIIFKQRGPQLIVRLKFLLP